MSFSLVCLAFLAFLSRNQGIESAVRENGSRIYSALMPPRAHTSLLSGRHLVVDNPSPRQCPVFSESSTDFVLRLLIRTSTAFLLLR